MKFKKYFLLVAMLILASVLVACGSEKASDEAADSTTETASNTEYAEQVTENPIVTITMENDAQIVVELDPKVAPNTVANFISLVEDQFYDGLIFHRVIPGFMIQGGDPSGNGSGGPDYTIDGEFSSNGFENNLTHERGVISMARTNDPNSAGSQFFIMTETSPHLDGEYAAFGKVIEGMDVVDAIVNAERDNADKPKVDQKMKSVTVDTKGFDYPDPIVNK